MCRAVPFAMLSLALLAAAAAGQEPRPYDGLRGGDDAYQAADEQRRGRIDQQLFLNDAMRARYGWPPAAAGMLGYGNAAAADIRPLGVDYAYAYSSSRLLGRRSRRLSIESYRLAPLSVFEPWPYVPGDIYGYDFPPSVRQPIAQRQIQTGPNRWESHPVYPEDLDADLPPAPPADSAAEPLPTPSAPAKPGAKTPHRRAF